MRRLIAIALALGSCAVGLSGCSKANQDREKVLAALRRTEQLSGRFVYDEKTSSADTTVKGVIADDYRYKSELDVNGTPTVEEAVVDDAVADHFIDPLSVPLLARRTAGGALLAPPADDAQAGKSGISVIDALQTQRWVIDATGAPAVIGASGSHPLGQDPIYDARTAFLYTEAAVSQAEAVRKYDSESIDPTYKSADDPFPKPKHGARLLRYDLAPRPIPRKDATSGGSNQRVPEVGTVRRMVVYVENGLVVRIMEVVNLDWKINEIRRNYSLSLTGSLQQQAQEALAGINAVRQGQGTDLIRARQMDFQFVDPGKSFDVALPTQAVYGPLHLLVNRGQASGSGAAGATTTTTAESPTTVGPSTSP